MHNFVLTLCIVKTIISLILMIGFWLPASAQSRSVENIYDANGVKWATYISQKDGIRKVVYYNSDGRIIGTGYYKNNKRNGTWQMWDEKGNLMMMARFSNGRHEETLALR